MRTLLIAALAVVALAGCLGDATQETDPPANPGTPGTTPPGPTYSGFGDIVGTGDTNGGQGIWIHEGILYHTDGGSLSIWDVADPSAPTLLGELSDIGARDVDVLAWQGTLYAVLAGSGRGMHLVDVSDPSDPTLVDTYELPSAGVHNLAALPGTPYIYSSGASGGTRAIDVLDITDPQNGVIHTFPIPASMGGIEIESDGCHDITVRADLHRAYCAGGGGKYGGRGGETFIWNITDPIAPQWISMMDDPRIKYHHQAFVNDDASILIINDEFIAPNCVNVDLPGVPGALDPQVPLAAAWVYDIRDEANPVQKSLVQNPSTTNDGVPNANCGSHFGDLVPGQDAFVMGWYQGGTMFVDFSDPANPQVSDLQPATGSTWDARIYAGHVYHSSGDLLVTPLI